MQHRGEVLHPWALAAFAGEPVEDLELADAQAELVEGLVEGDGRAGVACQELSPLGCDVSWHTTNISACIYCTCIRCICMYYVPG